MAVEIIVKIFVLTKKPTLEIRTAGAAGKGNFAEITAVQFFVSIDNKLKCGSVIS